MPKNKLQMGVIIMILRKTKKIMAALLFTGVFGLASAVSVFAFTGEGTQAEPYLIGSESELKELSDIVNGGKSYSDEYFELTSDLTMSENWTPIGTEDNPFAGFFDGGNHTINNMVVDTDGVAGLFGAVSTGAQIAHLTLDGGSVTTSGISAGGFVGKVIANGSGKIVVYDCVNKSCNVSGSTSGCTDGVGGIVGCAETATDATTYVTIEYCKTESGVNVYAEDSDVNYVGGIVGKTGASTTHPCIVRQCSNYGSVGYNGGKTMYGGKNGTGGIVGIAYSANGNYKKSLIYNCANYGNVYGHTDYSTGGICGRAIGTYTYVCRCYNEGVVTGTTFVGGIVGQDSSIVEGCYNATSPKGTAKSAKKGEIAGKYLYSGGTNVSVHIGYCHFSNSGTIAYNASGTALKSGANNISSTTKSTFGNSVVNMNESSIPSNNVTLYDMKYTTDVDSDTVSDIYKMFSQDTVEITLNYGSDEETKTVTRGGTYPVTTPSEKTGYTFDGWYTTKSGGMHRITDTDVVVLSHENTEGRTLYARWTADANASQVTKHTKADAANLLKEVAKNGEITYSKEYDEDGNNVVDMRDIIDILKEA